MKAKILLTIPAIAVADMAHAQSNLILYGIADAAIVEARSPNGEVTRVVSGVQNGTRWGIKGVEELSNGLTAKFVLESGFSLDTGAVGQGTTCNGVANGCLFGRRATVGLWGKVGGVELGRRDQPMTDVLN